MKKVIFAVFFMLILNTICQSEAATTYQFEITGLNYGSLTDSEKIVGFEGNITGASAGSDWVIDTVSSRYAGDIWIFDEGVIGDDTGFGGVDDSSSQDVWLQDGIVLTIISPNDTPLTLSNMVFYDYNDENYTGAAFSAQLNVVPIPGAFWLLGSGLIGMVGIRRKLAI